MWALILAAPWKRPEMDIQNENLKLLYISEDSQNNVTFSNTVSKHKTVKISSYFMIMYLTVDNFYILYVNI